MATISGLPRVDACPSSDVLPAIDEGDNAYSRHGRAVHAYLDAVAKGSPPAEALAAVAEEHRAACASIDLSLVPHSQLGAWSSEMAFALDYECDSARVLEAVDRQYGELGPTEIAGTADLVGLDADGETVVVLDVKTGRRWLGRPGEHLQLLAYARAAALAHGRTKARVGFIFVRDDESEPVMVLDDVDEFELELAGEHIKSVMRAVEWQRVTGEVTPRVGEHCTYCPAYRACPAHVTLVKAFLSNNLDTARSALGDLPVIQVEDLPTALQRVGAVIDLAERVRKELLDAVRAVGRIEMADGRVLTEVEKTREKLDPEVARPILDDAFGTDWAEEAIEKKVVLTKAAVEALCRRRAAQTKEKISSINETVLEAIRAAGGIQVSRYYAVEAVRPKRLKTG